MDPSAQCSETVTAQLDKASAGFQFFSFLRREDKTPWEHRERDASSSFCTLSGIPKNRRFLCLSGQQHIHIS